MYILSVNCSVRDSVSSNRQNLLPFPGRLHSQLNATNNFSNLDSPLTEEITTGKPSIVSIASLQFSKMMDIAEVGRPILLERTKYCGTYNDNKIEYP